MKIYYTIEKGIYDDGETLDGTKTISIYRIENNEPVRIVNIDCDLEDNSQKIVKEKLSDLAIKATEIVLL